MVKKERPYTPEISTNYSRVRCQCGEDISLGHPDRGPYLCTNCRRYWHVKVNVASEHEYEYNPIGAVRGMGQAFREIQNGRPVEEAIVGHGVDTILKALEEEDWIPPRMALGDISDDD